MKKEILGWIRDILIAILIALIVLALFKPIIIQQHSMEPNFYQGDYVITFKQAYRFSAQPEQGDIIVFRSTLKDSNGKDKNLIKRVIAVGGDTLEIIDGYVYVNGEELDEPYVLEEGMSGDMDRITVPEGKLFCCGDNRAVSVDSRDEDVGFVDEHDIVGKVILRLYPFNKIQTF
ncbi:MAG: signal peptidase I [Firmicutes bacterium]|nr:signal peptidase I [Bacillota bacterium]